MNPKIFKSVVRSPCLAGRQALSIVLFFFLLSPIKSHACGHEGWYAGLGYTQLLQFTPDAQLTAAAANAAKVDWDTRWGVYAKVGYDFCASRWGVEMPLGFDHQRLNKQEFVNIIGVDANALFHIVETPAGIDFYWIGGTGFNYAMEGSLQNNSRAGGINLNFGPGFQYFLKHDKPNMALGLSIPFKYTLYFGNNLSGNRRTSVIGIPVKVGFSMGF